jgi:MraZ protein
VAENPETGAHSERDASKGSSGVRLETQHELEVGFYGNPRAKLDERGRLKMPAEFKASIDQKYGEGFNEFYITSREGLDAEIFPLPAWERQWKTIMAMPPSSKARKDLVARHSYYGAKADMDPQGRVLLPEALRNAGMVNEDVTVTGEGMLLRVTAVSRLAELVVGKPMSAGNMDELARFGL